MRTRMVLVAIIAAGCELLSTVAAQERNQLQNWSFEEDWLISDSLARRRWGLIARAEDGYAGADGKLDHWESPTAWRDAAAHSGQWSVKLPVGQALKQAVRAAMRSPAGGNPASGQTDFQPLEPADLAKLEPRTVRGGAWVKAANLPADKARIMIAAGGQKAEVVVPAGTYDWRRIEVVSPQPWPAAPALELTIRNDAGELWVDDAFLAEDARGANLAVNGGFEQLDGAGWPTGYAVPEVFWWFRFDYYSWTGWSHDGGYGCQLADRIELVPGYRWRGEAAVDTLVQHGGRNSMRLVAFPGDNFGVLGPAVGVDGTRPFELGAWVKADRIHQVEVMALDAETNRYVLMDTDHFAGLEGVGVNAGSKGQGTYGWTYLRKLVCPRTPVKRIRPMVAVRGFDGRIIEKNHVGTVWFDDLEVIQRGGDALTPPAAAPADALRITEFALGERLWGTNDARIVLLSPTKTTAEVKLTITAPDGRQVGGGTQARLAANQPCPVGLSYLVSTLCPDWQTQYRAELAVSAGGKTQTIRTAFGTPSSLLASRVSGQFVFPEEKLVVAANVLVAHRSLAELSQVSLEIADAAGQVVTQMAVADPAGKLPVVVPEAKALEFVNRDRAVIMAPDLGKCRVRPWNEATRDYTVVVRLLGRDGKELARAAGMQFGRLEHFPPSELALKPVAGQAGRWEPGAAIAINDEHCLLVAGKPFFPVYFGEFGDTFRPEEGVNVTREQFACLGVNPLHLSKEEKAKYGMAESCGLGEWDLNGLLDLKPADVAAQFAKLRAAYPGKLVVSGYDLVSHPGSRRADVARYYFPAYDLVGMEASFGSYVPNLRVDYFPAMAGRNGAIMVGFEHYYFLSFDQLRYRSYLSIMRGAAGLGLIPSRMIEGRPECNNYLRGMNAECRALAPVFAAPPATPPTVSNHPALFTWEKVLNQKRYLFVVRGEPFLTRGLFQWTDKRTPGGQPSHGEARNDRFTQHWLENARPVMVPADGTILQEAWIEGAPPRLLALQFRTRGAVDHTWAHRAYWGQAAPARYFAEAQYPADQKPPQPWPAWLVVENPPQAINAAMERGASYCALLGGAACQATDGQPSLKRLGDVPAAGHWVTLRVLVAAVGLAGQALDGLGFAVDGGQVYWGKTALLTEGRPETALLDGSFANLADEPGEWAVTWTVPGTQQLTVRTLFENVTPTVAGNTFQDRLPLPYRARVYEITPR